MLAFLKIVFLTLCVFFMAHATLALLKAWPPNPGGSELLPETKEFIKKLEKATSAQDIKRLQEEDDTFMVHDFSESLPKDSVHLKQTCDRRKSARKVYAEEGAKTLSQNGNNDLRIEDNVESSGHAAEAVHSVTKESTPGPHSDGHNNGSNQQEPAIPNAGPLAAGGEKSAAAVVENSTAAGGKGAATGGENSTTAGGKSAATGGENSTEAGGKSAAAAGENSTAAGGKSAAAGGENSTAAGGKSAAAAGENSTATGGKSAAAGEENSTAAGEKSAEAGGENKTAEAGKEDMFELVDFGKTNDLTDPSGTTMSGYERLRHDHGTLAASVEHHIRDPSPKESSAGDDKDPEKKRKKKKKAVEQPPPTKEELDASYKYEVLAPPDNRPVKLDFPASPHAQGEEHLSQHVPLTLYCDTCMAIAYQAHLAFDKFRRQVTRRPPRESEVYHLVAEACRRSRYTEYGMLEVHGHRHISGPGCNQLEAEGGVKHSRGPWPRRLADRCEEVTEDIGELALHEAWQREHHDPERFKTFVCFGEPPRNYCQKYGHMDAAAEAAARLDSRAPEESETPIQAAGRLAREAEQAELRRIAEQAATAEDARDEL